MAKYTELLAEYLESGGELPAAFSQIEGFEDLFIGEYADHEIGFETPTLFALKLEARANLVIPTYVERIEAIKQANDILINPTKSRRKTGGITRKNGSQTVQNWDMPYNVNALPPTAHPTTQQTTGEREDKETYNDITDVEEGFTVSEALSYAERVTGSVNIIRRQLLNEFKNLFMQVY